MGFRTCMSKNVGDANPYDLSSCVIQLSLSI